MGHVKAVDDVSFFIKQGKTLGLVRESGCGKSTTGRTILRLIEATSGEIWFEGKDILALDKNEMGSMRKEMQIIFQDSYTSLNPRMTVADIVGEPLDIHNPRCLEAMDICSKEEPKFKVLKGGLTMNELPINMNSDKIKNTAKRISKFIKRTPCILAWELSEKNGYPIYLKLENLQITGGFKIRGNANKLSLMKQEEYSNGVVTASSGNHGLGMSLSAMRNSIEATVVVPKRTPKIKIKRLKNYNAKVIVEGKTYDDSVEIAKEISNDTGAVYIPSFDDPDIILGNSTMGLEIFEDVPDVKKVICPIGGGGGISGIGVAFKNLKPAVKIVGVQSEGASAMMRSINNGRLTKLNNINTLADGIAVSEPGKLPYKIVKQIVDEILLVSDEEMKKALQLLIKREKIIAELAGVASVTALDKINIPSNSGSIVCVITGGNIDTSMLVNILNQ